MSPMSPRLLRPRQSMHPEAADWAARVTAAGATYSGTTLTAVSKFCRSIDAAGIRSKFLRVNLFCGNSITAALIPLYRSSAYGGAVVGNASDTNNNFVSADYVETGASGGLKGNGTTKYLNTGVAANTNTATNSHLGVGVLATNTTAGVRSAIGAYNNSNNSFEIMMRSSSDALNRPGIFTRFGTATDRCGDGIGPSAAALPVGNNVAAYPTFYRNGVSVGTDATTSQDYPSAHSIYVFGVSHATTGNPGINLTDARFGWYSIGMTMSSSQALAFHNAIASFTSSMNRT